MAKLKEASSGNPDKLAQILYKVYADSDSTSDNTPIWDHLFERDKTAWINVANKAKEVLSPKF